MIFKKYFLSLTIVKLRFNKYLEFYIKKKRQNK